MTAAHIYDVEAVMDAVAPHFDGSQPCAQTDPELFFPNKGGDPAAAKRLCGSCEFREPCLDYALVTTVGGYPMAGVWGGTSVRDRNRIRRERDGVLPETVRAHAERDERILTLAREGLSAAAIVERLGLNGQHIVFTTKKRHGITSTRALALPGPAALQTPTRKGPAPAPVPPQAPVGTAPPAPAEVTGRRAPDAAPQVSPPRTHTGNDGERGASDAPTAPPVTPSAPPARRWHPDELRAAVRTLEDAGLSAAATAIELRVSLTAVRRHRRSTR